MKKISYFSSILLFHLLSATPTPNNAPPVINTNSNKGDVVGNSG